MSKLVGAYWYRFNSWNGRFDRVFVIRATEKTVWLRSRLGNYRAPRHDGYTETFEEALSLAVNHGLYTLNNLRRDLEKSLTKMEEVVAGIEGLKGISEDTFRRLMVDWDGALNDE